MKREDLLKRIENLDFFTISKMSPEVLLRLTDNFKEPMVLKLVARARTNASQRIILSSVKKAYVENQKKTNPSWGMWGSEKYPEYLENLQLDIECGRLIMDEEEVQKKIDKKMDVYMTKHTMTKEDIEKAITDAEIITVTDEKSSEIIAALEERIKELVKENKELKEQLTQKPTAVENTEAMDSLKKENERISKEHEEMIVELLKPIFYKSEQDVKEFLEKIDGRPDTEIIDTVCEFSKARKLSDKSKGRPLWSVLHAAKYYSSTESNWNTALRNHP